MVSKAIRDLPLRSTTLVGEIFCVWCAERRGNPSKASEVELADFILHLVEDKMLSVSSISGYRSHYYFCTTIEQLSKLLEHSVIRVLLREIKLQQAQKPIKSKLPAWNLTFVLRALTKIPFEPINNSSLLHLSWKTGFLLLLASGRRRGEFCQ